jgi:hypothetical protein
VKVCDGEEEARVRDCQCMRCGESNHIYLSGNMRLDPGSEAWQRRHKHPSIYAYESMLQQLVYKAGRQELRFDISSGRRVSLQTIQSGLCRIVSKIRYRVV